MSPEVGHGYCKQRNITLEGEEVRAEAEKNHFIKEIIYDKELNSLMITYCTIPPVC